MKNVFTAIVSRKANWSSLSCAAWIILRFVEIDQHYLILTEFNNTCTCVNVNVLLKFASLIFSFSKYKTYLCNSYHCIVIHHISVITQGQHACMFTKAVHINNKIVQNLKNKTKTDNGFVKFILKSYSMV